MSLYFLLLRIAALFNGKAKRLVQGEKKAFQELEANIEPHANYVWFHAASVGEFEQARPLIEKLKAEQPSVKILLTFFSPSGYEMRKNYPLVDVVSYLPFATRKKARKFVELVRPQKAIFIKYEFWPNYLKALQKNNIPTYVVAAIFNKKQVFFRWYGAFYRSCLKNFTTLFVQDKSSAQLLAKYKINNAVVCGDTRFDRVSAIASNANPIPIVSQFIQNQPVLVAGSTWEPDEDLLIKYYCQNPTFKLIIVPHEVTDAHLHSIFQKLEGRIIRYTEATPENINTANCLVIDTMGLLSQVYQYATVAYVGGGFGAGIHNTIEPAVYGVSVVFGPHYKKFREACGLIACQGGFSVKNQKALNTMFDQIFETPKEFGINAGRYVQEELGATDAIYNAILK